MARIDFSRLEELLDAATSFSLSERQYEQLTGRAMPKDTSYLIHRSALSRFAAEKGLKVTVREKEITFEKGE